MRLTHSLVGLLVAAVLAAAGCHRGVGDIHEAWGPMKGRLAYNLPPAERLMEPGPGVGGPGPGIIPPVDPAMGGVMTDGSVIQASYGGGFGPGGLQAALSADLPDPGLAKVAEETGGGYTEIRAGQDLAAEFARVADELHSQYTLGFEPPKRDGKKHDIDVRLKKGGMKARARKDYIAPKE